MKLGIKILIICGGGGADKLGFAMPYYNANNFIDFFETNAIESIKEKVYAILSFIDSNIRKCSSKCIEKEILYNKCLEIESKLLPPIRQYFSPLLLKIQQEIDSLAETIELPIGRCHGDLTFSNILFFGQKIVLIDFLDSFIETPLQDMVKLRQDTKHLWSLNLYKNKFDIAKIKMILDFLDRIIHAHFQIYPFYEMYYGIFQKINLLRILPYAKEEKIIQYLFREISIQ